MKINKEWIILTAIILLLVLYLTLRKQDNIQYQLPEIEKISQNDISSIEIAKSDSKIHIKKKDDSWVIDKQEYLADKHRVENMLNLMERPVLTAMVSDSKSYSRYGLDNDNRITIRIFSGENMKREVELGDITDLGRHTFIKLDNDYRVYHARNNFRDPFSRGIDELRDKTIFSFDQSVINEIEISKDTNSVVLTLKEDLLSDKSIDKDSDTDAPPIQGTKKIWKNSKGEEVDVSLPDDLLSTLSSLFCSGYLYDTKKEDWSDPILAINLKGIKEYSLLIFSKKDETEVNYPATSSTNDYPFKLADWRIEDIFETTDKILENAKDS
jgi:hypothetical protein